MLSHLVRLQNSPYCFIIEESDHIEPNRLCAGPQLQLPVFRHLLLRRSPIATGRFVWLRMCACCCCVYIIKNTCAVNWIIVMERSAVSTSSRPDLAGARGKTVSRHLELSPDAVDDHDVFCALSCSSCSTTCCCIAVWAAESEKWFLPLQLPKQTLHSWNRQVQICRFLSCLLLDELRAPSALDIATQIRLIAIQKQ